MAPNLTLKTWLVAGSILAGGSMLAACDSGSQTQTDTQPPETAETTAPDTPTTAAAQPMPLGRLGTTITPISYDLDITIDPSQETFSGTTRLEAVLNVAADGIWLHGLDITVSDAAVITADGTRVPATYEQRHVTGIARLDFDQTLAPGPVTLELPYEAPFTNSPAGLYHTQVDGAFYTATQFEPIDARRVFPGFDEPRFKVPFTISVTARTGDQVVVAMPETGAEDLGNGMTRRTFETTPPLPTYLLAFAVGPYDVNAPGPIPPNAVRAEPLPFRGLAARGQGPRMDYAMRNTADILTYQENYFGIAHPYPKLDIIAAPNFFGGAMENVGAIMYNDFLMLMDESSPLRQRRAYTSVHAHELAHQWFGNLVTPVWWDDIWLNEAFASWMENKTADAVWPEGEFGRATLSGALGAMTEDALLAARQIREPVAVNEAIEDAFDGITYEKGAGVLAMFEGYVGEDAFRDGVRLHMERHANDVATVEDFMSSIADGAGKPEVIPAFRSFIDQPGVPLLEASVTCDGDSAAMALKQSRFRPLGSAIDPASTWQIPLCVAYDGAEGRTRTCALVSEAEQTVLLETEGQCPSAVIPNADGAAYVRFSYDEAGWSALASHVQDLPATEALVYGDSLASAFEAGLVSAGTMLDGMAALAGHEAWDASAKARGTLTFLMDRVIAPEERPALEQFARSLAAPTLERVGLEASGDDAPAAILQRSGLVGFLAMRAKEPALRATMARQAAAYLGLPSDADPSDVSTDLLSTVLMVGVQDGGAPVFEALLEKVQGTQDTTVRAYGIQGLAATKDPELSARLLDLSVTDAFNATEMFRIMFSQASQSETRDAAWAWFQANFDTIAARVPSLFRSGLASYGRVFCSTQRKGEFTAFIKSKADAIPGYERSLAQATESIDLCVALKDAKSAELAEAVRERL